MDVTAELALAALVLTNIGLIIGWLVSGTQRVAEDLVKERRSRYLALLAAVEAARREGGGPDVPQALTAAELVATEEMLRSHLLSRLAAAVDVPAADWAQTRAAFLVPARFESQKNQELRRRRRSTSLYGMARGGK